jgi:zinc protease
LSGSEADPAQQAGLASLTAGLLTKGSQQRSASAFAVAAESLGSTFDSSAGWHQAGVSMTVAAPYIDTALSLVSDAVQHPHFALTELERLRTQMLDDLKLAYSRPSTLASLAAQHMLFGTGAYGHPTSGTPESLRRIKRADLIALHAAHYRPDNAVLILAGDLDAPSALELARRHFGSWVAPTAPAPNLTVTVGVPLAQNAVVIDMPNSGQATVVVALALPPLGSHRAAASVMNSVLGGGFSSRLSQEIRIKRGLSYSANSQLDARPAGSTLHLVVQTKNESAAEVANLMQVELDRLMNEAVSETELAARKATLIGNFSRSVETTAGLAAVIKSLIVAGMPSNELSQRIAALNAVSATDLQTLAKTTLRERRVVAIAGESSKFAAALKKTLSTPAIIVPASELNLELGDGLSVHSLKINAPTTTE